MQKDAKGNCKRRERERQREREPEPERVRETRIFVASSPLHRSTD